MTWTEAKAEASRILGSLRERYDLKAIRLIIRALGREYFRTREENEKTNKN